MYYTLWLYGGVKVFILLIASKKICSPIYQRHYVCTSWLAMFIISLFTTQNMFHLEFNFSLLILDNISTEAVDSVVSMVFMTPPSFLRRIDIDISWMFCDKVRLVDWLLHISASAWSDKWTRHLYSSVHESLCWKISFKLQFI